MNLTAITQDIGAYTRDAILITKAEPICENGPEILWCNRAFTEMTGYKLDEVIGKTPRILQGKDTPRPALDKIRAALKSWSPVVTVVKNYTKSGDPFYAELSIVPVADASGWYQYWVAVQRDVSQRVEYELNLKERNRRLAQSEKILQDEKLQLAGIAAIAEHSQDLITITDFEFRILWANNAFLARSGYPASAVRGSRHCDLLAKRSVENSPKTMAEKAIAKGSFKDDEVRNLDRAGAEFWTAVRVTAQRDDSGRAERLIVVERDISEERRQRVELERSQRDLTLAAKLDRLTGLLNRRGFEQALEQAAAQAEALGHGLGLLLLDLDRFKQINDTMGHAAGDAVLQTVSARLEKHLGPDAFAGRIGGDEFVVAVELRRPKRDLAELSRRIIDDVTRPVRHAQAELRFGASIGYCQRMEAPFTASALMVEADIALYRAKDAGRGRAQAYTPTLAQATREKKALGDKLVVAAENGEFFPLYQPQFDARTGALAGAEALARWRGPDHAVRSPAEFLDLARELGLEPSIDQAILRHALRDLEAMRVAGLALPKISVNVSARRLASDTLIDELDALSIPPGVLSFELLESIFLDDSDDQTLWTLSALKERGISVEIDDFGTGHASIMGLLRVAPDRLKTDKSLIGPAADDPRRRELFRLIVEMGRTLDINVTAEGIETAAEAALARELGCAVLQGYHFAKPMPANELIAAHRGGATVAG